MDEKKLKPDTWKEKPTPLKTAFASVSFYREAI